MRMAWDEGSGCLKFHRESVLPSKALEPDHHQLPAMNQEAPRLLLATSHGQEPFPHHPVESLLCGASLWESTGNSFDYLDVCS